MKCYFSIDKQKSLDIIRSIQSTAPKLREDVDDKADWPKCYEHKLAMVELEVSGTESDTIEDYYDEIIEKSNDAECYNRSEQIDIAEIDIRNDTIDIYGYLHETTAECDWSYPTFSYDEVLQTWLIRDSLWSAPNGIGLDGRVIILDFNNYK